jgi:hypothetical protein
MDKLHELYECNYLKTLKPPPNLKYSMSSLKVIKGNKNTSLIVGIGTLLGVLRMKFSWAY